MGEENYIFIDEDNFEYELDGRLYFSYNNPLTLLNEKKLISVPKEYALYSENGLYKIDKRYIEEEKNVINAPHKLRDSGARRKFESGAVRDISEGKGRCDLLPLDIVNELLYEIREDATSDVISHIDAFVDTGDRDYILKAIEEFIDIDWQGPQLWEQARRGNDVWSAILEVSKHYEDGAKKYSDRNWEKGIPLHCFIDSGVRHYLKYKRGDKDEPHDRAFIWNMLGALWTMKHHPELDDITGDKKYGKENS